MKKIDKRRERELRALRKMKEGEIDLSDIPEITDFSNAVVAKFYRPVKKPVTVRTDSDL